jgi:hypothetical protein
MQLIKLRDSTPDWLYYKANVTFDNLKEIQTELFNIFVKCTGLDTNTLDSSFNLTIDIPMIREQGTSLMSLLKSIELDEYLESIAFISARKETDFPIHVDGTVDFALNIPVLNCENSYTAWYYSKIGNLNVEPKAYGQIDDYSNSVALLCDASQATEITRIDANIPHWININVPHRPIVLGEGFRINASLRFSSKILDENKPPKNLICT